MTNAGGIDFQADAVLVDQQHLLHAARDHRMLQFIGHAGQSQCVEVQSGSPLPLLTVRSGMLQ